jgi:hypothetical protein
VGHEKGSLISRRTLVLAALLLLGPVVVVLDHLGGVGDVPLFVLAATALVPLS